VYGVARQWQTVFYGKIEGPCVNTIVDKKVNQEDLEEATRD
jgi:hypothetical protein